MLSVEPLLGTRQVTLAVNQPEYDPLSVALFVNTELQSPTVVSRWKLSQDEVEAILRGEDIYIGISTFGQRLQPLMIQVGREGLEAPNLYSNLVAVNAET